MSLKRNVFVRVMVLIVTLVLVICVTYSIFAIRHHRQEMKILFKMKALILAGEVERLILWDDRVAMREALAREVKNHPEVMYVFIERERQPYVHAFEKGVPQTLLTLQEATNDIPSTREFLDSEGKHFYDIAVPLEQPDVILHMGLGRNEIDQALRPLLIAIAGIGLGAVIVGVVLAILFARQTTKEADLLTTMIRESENRFRSLVEQAIDAFFVFDRDGIIIGANNRACETLGYTNEELLSMSLLDIDEDSDASELKEPFWEDVTHTKSLTLERIHRRKDGSTFPVEISLGEIDVNERKVMLALARDVTARKGAEEELIRHRDHLAERVDAGTSELRKANKELQQEIRERRQAEEKIEQNKEFLGAIIESLTHPFMVIDAENYTIIKANKAAQHDSAAEGRHCYEVSHNRQSPCEEPDHVCPLKEVVRTGKPLRVEHIHFHEDGRPQIVEIHASPLFDERGRVVQVAEYAFDITERKEGEEIVLASQDRLKAINQIGVLANASLELEEVLNSILSGTIEASGSSVGMIFLKDLESGCLKWGASMGLPSTFEEDYRERLIQPGEGLAGCIAQTGETLFIPENASDDPRMASPIVVAEGLNSFLGVPINVSGEIIAVMIVLTRPPKILIEEEVLVVSAVGGHVGSAIRNAQLFEERKRTERKLKASLQEKELLLREVHHRVKNNMQIISSLLKHQSASMKEESHIELFKDSQDRINSMALIHEQLYRSKDLSDVDFQEYIKDLAQSLYWSHGVSANNVRLKIDVGAVSLGVDTAIPCGLIINELVSNSLKHAFPEGKEGEIGIALSTIDDSAFQLSVRDDGVGISEALDFRNTESLGLKLVINLAEYQLRGKVELSRKAGTEFRIRFEKIEYGDRIIDS